MKFADLLKVAQDLGADCLVTGHYVRRVVGPWGPELHRAIDPARDQSYFLFATTAGQPTYLRFPSGGLEKREVRALAQKHALGVAANPDRRDRSSSPAADPPSAVRPPRPAAADAGSPYAIMGRAHARHL